MLTGLTINAIRSNFISVFVQALFKRIASTSALPRRLSFCSVRTVDAYRSVSRLDREKGEEKENRMFGTYF